VHAHRHKYESDLYHPPNAARAHASCLHRERASQCICMYSYRATISYAPVPCGYSWNVVSVHLSLHAHIHTCIYTHVGDVTILDRQLQVDELKEYLLSSLDQHSVCRALRFALDSGQDDIVSACQQCAKACLPRITQEPLTGLTLTEAKVFTFAMCTLVFVVLSACRWTMKHRPNAGPNA
jgi:hypothetical protein